MANTTYEHLFSHLRAQGYHIVGNHSAVKRCKWYKESILDRGECYKAKFYGIKSHQCMQSTPALQFCTQNCVFCWRVQAKELGMSEKNELPTPEFRWDPPDLVLDGLIREQLEFAKGYKGNPHANQRKVEEAMHPKLLTLSLAGEPTLYPYLPGLIKLAKDRGFLVFLVTNGTVPAMLERLNREDALPTQLYISMDAPDFESYLVTCRPSAKQFWDRYNESLNVMRTLKGKTRTVLRMTLVRSYNTERIEGYAKQIETAQPDYVEVKSFVYVGGARHPDRNLTLQHMLSMDEIRTMARELSRLTGYEYTDEHVPSRVVLLVRDKEAMDKRVINY